MKRRYKPEPRRFLDPKEYRLRGRRIGIIEKVIMGAVVIGGVYLLITRVLPWIF